MGINTDASTHMLTKLPEFTRNFPREIDFLLPLRHSMRFYSAAGGSVVTSDESPETDASELSTGEMYEITIQVSICGHATFITDNSGYSGCMQVCEPAYRYTNSIKMVAAIQILNSSPLRWVNRFENKNMGPTTPPNMFVMRMSLGYRVHGPLLAY